MYEIGGALTNNGYFRETTWTYLNPLHMRKAFIGGPNENELIVTIMDIGSEGGYRSKNYYTATDLRKGLTKGPLTIKIK